MTLESDHGLTKMKRSFLPKGLMINNQFVVGKEKKHIGERYSLFELISDGRLVVQAVEEFATSANIFAVDPRYGSP